MFRSVSLAALIALSSAGAANALDVKSNQMEALFPRFPHDDLGCRLGEMRGTKFDSVYYDARTGDRVQYNVSRCTGGFIRGENQGQWWDVRINANGDISGVDVNGSRWTYDRRAGRYFNLTTGRSCATTDARVVCP